MVVSKVKKCFSVSFGIAGRSVLCHVGSKDVGLLEDCMLLFRGSKSSKSSDYHTEMNWNVFSHWYEFKVFLSLERVGRKALIVLDQAIYQTVLDEDDKWPVETWNKTRLVNSTIRCNAVPDNWLLTWAHQKSKSELLEVAIKSILRQSMKYRR